MILWIRTHSGNLTASSGYYLNTDKPKMFWDNGEDFKELAEFKDENALKKFAEIMEEYDADKL